MVLAYTRSYIVSVVGNCCGLMRRSKQMPIINELQPTATVSAVALSLALIVGDLEPALILYGLFKHRKQYKMTVILHPPESNMPKFQIEYQSVLAVNIVDGVFLLVAMDC
jgi:hypothetical protein